VEQKKAKGQKGFAIVNIVMGVILVIAGFAMFSDPSVGPGGILALLIGAVLWCIGAYALSTFHKHYDEETRMKKARLINTVCFVVSCVVLATCTVLPIVAPLM